MNSNTFFHLPTIYKHIKTNKIERSGLGYFIATGELGGFEFF